MRICEFRHLFSGKCRITATIRIDLDHARLFPGAMGCVRCRWEGSRERQSSTELYEEYRRWVDGIWRWFAAELGTRYMGVLETPMGCRTLALRTRETASIRQGIAQPPRESRSRRPSSGCRRGRMKRRAHED
jgi:hypothetical protein